jgi:hypothetical protein
VSFKWSPSLRFPHQILYARLLSLIRQAKTHLYDMLLQSGTLSIWVLIQHYWL